MKTLTYIFIIFCCFPNLCFGQNDQISAKIETENLEGMLKIRAVATNNSPFYRELDYLMVSIKKGASGNLSNNKQSGKFSINPEETKKLSEVTLNLQKNDALKIYLYIRDEQIQKINLKRQSDSY